MTPIQFVARYAKIVNEAACVLPDHVTARLLAIEPHDLVDPDQMSVDPQGVILRAAIRIAKEFHDSR